MQTISVKPLQLGDEAPDFMARSTMGNIQFHAWLNGSWCVFFSHPNDFTPVCTTELGYAARIKEEFDRRKVKVISLSVNDLDSHERWIRDINETQNTTMNFPMIADPERKIAQLYGMIHPQASDNTTVRTLFIIDPAHKIRLMIVYPASTGRNFEEILRVIDSLQLTDSHKVATPVNWHWGDDCIILPKITDPKEINKLFPKGYRELKPYLRYTAQPK